MTRRLDGVLSGLHGSSVAGGLILHHLARATGARLRRIDDLSALLQRLA